MTVPAVRLELPVGGSKNSPSFRSLCPWVLEIPVQPHHCCSPSAVIWNIFSSYPRGFYDIPLLKGKCGMANTFPLFSFFKSNITWAFQCIVTSILNFVWVWFWWTGKDYFFSCIAIFNKVFSLQWQFSNSCNTGSCVLSVLLCKHNLALKSPPVLSSWQKLFSSHSFHYF